MTTQDQSTWMRLGEALAFLGVSPKTLARLADNGKISRRAIPGAHPRFLRADVEALAERCTSHANSAA
jgi:excisionase family DNA binding protein